MSIEQLMNPFFIGLAVLFIIVFIWFLVYYFKNRNKLADATKKYEQDKQSLIEKYESEREETRLEHRKEVSSLNDKYHKDTTDLNNKLQSVLQFSTDKSEYLTDLSLFNLKKDLVLNEKIRESDMIILSNIYIPSRNYTNTRKIDHLVLTRTGIYLIDSTYWKGHILHGVNENDFDALPYVENFFDLLELDKSREQTLLFTKSNDTDVKVEHYNHIIEETNTTAEKLRNMLKLQYDIVPIIYFNPEDNGNYSISNYSNDPSVKVLVGEEELHSFFNKYVFHGRFQYTVKDLDEIAEQILSLNP